ncbi:EAL domain-containing protein [Chromobacterium subtsugae]|nr:EAL domain-containing protein [Chromobacterium subtsugae]
MHDQAHSAPTRESLVAALRKREFSMHYQPQLSCRTARVAGAEALMRWHSAERNGPVSPASFIPLAEQSGFIVELGDWSMASALRMMAAWRDEARLPADFRLAINLSRRQIVPELPGKVERLIAQAGLEPSCVELEITESYLFHDLPTMVEVTRQLRKLGVRVAIDDFGTGFSVLEHLRHIPATTIKIDCSFTRQMLEIERDHIIMRNLIRMVRDLGMESVCEGVETMAQLEAVKDMGADYWQGFLFSPALPGAEFRGLLDAPGMDLR